MNPLPQEQREAALGLTYAIRRLKHSTDLVAAVNKYDGYEHGYELHWSRLRRRLSEIEQSLRRAGNLLDMQSTSQFGNIGIAMVERATEDDQTFISNINERSPCEAHFTRILDRFDKTVRDYILQYPIVNTVSAKSTSDVSNGTRNHSSGTITSPLPPSVPNPTPTWVWDHNRREYYRYDENNMSYVYASGLTLDANFRPLQPEVRPTQLAITTGEFGVGGEEVN